MRILAEYHQKQIKNLTEHLIPELEVQNIISDLMIHVLSEKQKGILLKPTELVLKNGITCLRHQNLQNIQIRILQIFVLIF